MKYFVVKGIVKDTSSWVELTKIETEENATDEQLENGANEFRNLVAHAFKSGNSGYMTVGNAVINIQSFAAISISIE
jgi:hypothetical protein